MFNRATSKSSQSTPSQSTPWILILGKSYYDWLDYCPEGTSSDARVSFADTVKDALCLIRQETSGPTMILIDADDLGGLEQAMQCHRRIANAAIYGKCLIKSRAAVLSQDVNAVPLLLASPKSHQMH